MKKTINVTIGGLVFSIEDDGYDKLNAYLESLKAHFANVSYGSEVITDIESRIAEQFNAKISGNTQRAISLSNVEEVLKAIGSVEDFESTDTAKATFEPTLGAKKFYRSSDDVIIAGVASGIAVYLGLNVTLVRVIFAITIFAGGWGILLYLLLWLLVPQATTPGQKLEMTGQPITIKQIEQTAKEKISEVKASGWGRKISRLIGFIIKLFVRIILGIIGVSLTFAATISTLSIAFTAANLLFNRNSPYIDFPIGNVFHGASYFFVLPLAFIIAVIPLIFLGVAGITLCRMKKPPINGMLALVLVIVWVVALITGSVITLNKLPDFQAAARTYSGDAETVTINAADFQAIATASAYHVHITQGKTYSVTATGHTKDLEESDISVRNGALTAEHKDNFGICFFCFGQNVSLNVTMPNLESVHASGASTVDAAGFNPQNFSAELSGASRVTLNNIAVTNNAKLDLSGASHLIISGSAQSLSAGLSGASRIEAFSFPINDAEVDLSGASHAEVSASKTLSVQASGASSLFYHGNPQLTKDEEFGSSHIQQQ